MSEDPPKRRLTTILAADVVGYSRLMADDEAGTHKMLKLHRAELIAPQAAKYNGRTIKLMGDGILMEFGSVIDAVAFAVVVQRAMLNRSEGIAADRQIRFRVGINIGDVIVDGEDIYGDGVNVAARLEQIADPGSVCVSRSVFNQVKNKLEIGFQDMGHQQLKNIPEAVHVYRVVLDGGQASSSASRPNKPLPIPDKPSIAVLPFDNMSGDPEQDFFGEGLAEDVITTLSKIQSLFVIARNSSFAFKGRATDIREIAARLGVRYVLEGSVRKSAQRLRVNAQLIDAINGHHIWAERYDREVSDIFDIQDEMTREIVSALRLKLSDGEQSQIWLRDTKNIVAWTCVMQAMELVMEGSPGENARARQLLERAIAEDPGYTLALAWIGKTHIFDARFGFSASPETSVAKANEIGEQALSQNPNEAYAHHLVSLVRSSQGRYEEAVAEARIAAELSPNDPYIKLGVARVLINAGRPADAEPLMQEAMRLNPFHHSYYFGVLANALEQLGRNEEAISLLELSVARDPDYFSGHLRLASLYGLSGRTSEAKAQVSTLLRINPRFDLSRAPSFYLTANPDFLAHFIEGLRAAGLDDKRGN